MSKQKTIKTKDACRVNVYSRDGEYCGWFDRNASTVLAKHESGSPYTEYEWIYLTAGGKLVLEESNTFGGDEKYYLCKKSAAIRLIVEAGTEAGDVWAEKNEKAMNDFCIDTDTPKIINPNEE